MHRVELVARAKSGRGFTGARMPSFTMKQSLSCAEAIQLTRK
jgi:hypothetical protein